MQPLVGAFTHRLIELFLFLHRTLHVRRDLLLQVDAGVLESVILQNVLFSGQVEVLAEGAGLVGPESLRAIDVLVARLAVEGLSCLEALARGQVRHIRLVR